MEFLFIDNTFQFIKNNEYLHRLQACMYVLLSKEQGHTSKERLPLSDNYKQTLNQITDTSQL